MRALILQAGNYAKVITDDTLVMWVMKTKCPINLGYYVIVARKKDVVLTYWMLITKSSSNFMYLLLMRL